MRPLATALTAVLLLTAACGGADDDAPDAADATLEPAVDTAPAAGVTRVECRLPTPDGPVRFRVDLPEGWGRAGTYGAPGCSYDNATSRITLGPVDDGDDGLTVQQIYDDQLPDLVDDEGDSEGDDSIYDLVLEEDVPVFGSTVGDRVSWLCFCDGAPVVNDVVQAAGIELHWTSEPDTAEANRRDLEQVLAGAGLVP